MLRQRFGQADAIEYLRELNGHRELLKKLTRLHAEVEKAHSIRKAEAAGCADTTSRALRTVSMGYAYQPPACCTYQRRRASLDIRVPASAGPYVPRTVAPNPNPNPNPNPRVVVAAGGGARVRVG